jgi:esterase/lipase
MDLVYILLIAFGSLLLICLILYVILGYTLYRFSFSRCDHDPNKLPNVSFINLPGNDKWFNNVNKKEVTIKSFDNLTLTADYMFNPANTHKYLITAHGYKGLHNEMSLLASHLYEKGYSTLMIYQRGVDKSQGKVITMGYKERYDVLKWINFILNEDKDAEICLYGISLGGATVMFTLGEKDLPKNVKCAIEDAGYGNIKKQMVFVARRYFKHLPINFSMGAVNFICRLHGFNINLDVKDTLSKSNTPILMIHGKVDEFVPYLFLDYNYSCVKDGVYKQKETFLHANHVSSIGEDKDRYFKLVDEFCDKFIK